MHFSCAIRVLSGCFFRDVSLRALRTRSYWRNEATPIISLLTATWIISLFRRAGFMLWQSELKKRRGSCCLSLEDHGFDETIC
jgi:hypothetical protein